MKVLTGSLRTMTESGIFSGYWDGNHGRIEHDHHSDHDHDSRFFHGIRPRSRRSLGERALAVSGACALSHLTLNLLIFLPTNLKRGCDPLSVETAGLIAALFAVKAS
jgi:hypothetical protein